MKYAQIYQIGRIDPKESRLVKENLTEGEASSEKSYLLKEANIKTDFETLRLLVKDMGFFKPSYLWFLFQAIQIVGFQILGYYTLWNYGYGVLPLLFSSLFLIMAQVSLCFKKNSFCYFLRLIKILIRPISKKYWTAFIRAEFFTFVY